MRIKVLVTLLLCCFMMNGSYAGDFPALSHNNPLKTGIDSLVHVYATDFFNSTDAPGVALSVYQNGFVSFYTYGYADKEQNVTFTDTTLFEIGSITKTFTANIIIRLQQEGKINIDQPFIAFLPDSLKNNNQINNIALRRLLNHTSGLPRLPDNMDKVKNYNYLQPYENYREDDLFGFLKTAHPDTSGKYDYSNLGYGLLGTIAAKQSGESYEKLLKEYIFKPLSMNHSSVSETEMPKATGYMNGKAVPYWKFSCIEGAGAIKSTSRDMMLYLQACMDTSKKGFSDVINTLIKPTAKINDALQIGLAWHIMTNLDNNIYWHNGGTYGFSTFAAFEPVTQTAMFAVANAFNVNEALEAFAGRTLFKTIENK